MGDAGAAALSEVLKKLTHLQILDIGTCAFTSNGIRSLAPGLQELKELKWFFCCIIVL